MSCTYRAALPVGALAAAVALALTGCGGGGSAAPAEGKQQLKVVVAPIQFEAAHIAQQEGFFEDEGLEVEIVPGADPAANMAMAVSGEADLVTASWGVMTTSIASGVPVKAVAGNGIVSPTGDNSGVMVRPDSDIDGVRGLAGKTVGMVSINSGGDIPMLQAMIAEGGDPSAITQVNVPYAGMQAALEQGTVDAVFPADNFYHQMVEAGYKVVSNPIREYQAYSSGTLWAATDQWLQANPETAEKFSAALGEAISYYSDPENVESVRAITAEVKSVDVAAVNPKTYATLDPAFYVEAGQKLIDAYEELGLVKDPKTAEEMIWEGAARATP
jgi:NitT/TauT family transport system substrate-binding protein